MLWEDIPTVTPMGIITITGNRSKAMGKNQLFYLMQLAGGTFPSGGFSQSWGLETYVAEGTITDSASSVSYTHLDVYKRQV